MIELSRAHVILALHLKNKDRYQNNKLRERSHCWTSLWFTITAEWGYTYFENSVDPDQLASEKPADQDPHCFPLYMLTTGILQGNGIKIGVECCAMNT